MNISILLIFGYLFTLCQHGASYIPDGTDSTDEEEYTKIKPGTKILFRSIKGGNLMIGPRLSPCESVTIHVVGDGGVYKGLSRAGKLRHGLVKYSVLKSGVLVPKLEGGSRFVDSNDLIPDKSVYKSRKPTFYVKGFKGILIPINLLYSKSKQRAIIDSEALVAKRLAEDSSGDRSEDEEGADCEHDKRATDKGERTRKEFTPDRTCNGDITMFVLRSNGVLQRMPPDPYLPMGIKLSYTVKDNFLIRPRMLEKSDDFVVHYRTGPNGDLVPSPENRHRINAEEGGLVSFMLGECGTLIPVREKATAGEEISYYFNGELIYKSSQFPKALSNSEVVVVNDKKRKLHSKTSRHRRKRSVFEEEYTIPADTSYFDFRQPSRSHIVPRHDMLMRPGSVHVEPMLSRPPIHVEPIMTRDPRIHASPSPVYESIPYEPVQSTEIPVTHYPIESSAMVPPPEITPRSDVYPVEPEFAPVSPAPVIADVTTDCPDRVNVRTDLFINDEKGIKIPLIPEVTEQNDVVLYKLTCKGNLIRYPPCKEPEYGFEIHFQLLLDEFILVPIKKNNRPLHITYILQENGDLVPKESNANTFKKAPGSLIYFMLGRNNVLFPVQQKIGSDSSVSFYYQDYYLLKLKNTSNKPLHFSTLSRPLFAFFNGLTVITCSSKPRLNPSRGSNWKSHRASAGAEEATTKDIFLSGPNNELIRVAPYKTRTGSTVLYELDSNGILYRSPKDKKKCIILRSYIILKEGIFIPSNETSGYTYMTSKNGDMFPYLYPDGRLEAPQGESLKYLLCEKGILLPIEQEIVDSHICYFFRDVVVYREKVYSKDSLDFLSDGNFMSFPRRDDCESSGRRCESCKAGVKPFTTNDGVVVYYEKLGSVLKRHPPDKVPPSLCYTMGSFEVQPDGSLFQIRYQDSDDDDVINLMLDANGDLIDDNRSERPLAAEYFILDVNGNLIAVEGRKTKKSIYFYKNQFKVCKVRLVEAEAESGHAVTTETKVESVEKDPLKLLDEPNTVAVAAAAAAAATATTGDAKPKDEPMYVPIPLKSVSMQKKKCGDKAKCDALKETMALELEINDEVMEEIRNWAAKCNKILSRREVEKSLTEALQGLNVSGIIKEEPEAS